MSGEITEGTKVLVPACLVLDCNGALVRVEAVGQVDGFLDVERRTLLSLETLRDVLRTFDGEEVDENLEHNVPRGTWCRVCGAFTEADEEFSHKPDCDLARVLSTLDEMAGTPKEDG